MLDIITYFDGLKQRESYTFRQLQQQFFFAGQLGLLNVVERQQIYWQGHQVNIMKEPKKRILIQPLNLRIGKPPGPQFKLLLQVTTAA